MNAKLFRITVRLLIHILENVKRGQWTKQESETLKEARVLLGI